MAGKENTNKPRSKTVDERYKFIERFKGRFPTTLLTEVWDYLRQFDNTQNRDILKER